MEKASRDQDQYASYALLHTFGASIGFQSATKLSRSLGLVMFPILQPVIAPQPLELDYVHVWSCRSEERIAEQTHHECIDKLLPSFRAALDNNTVLLQELD